MAPLFLITVKNSKQANMKRKRLIWVILIFAFLAHSCNSGSTGNKAENADGEPSLSHVITFQKHSVRD